MKIKKYEEVILYLIFGVLTTIVNIIVYYLLTKLGLWYILSNILAWAIAVLFAFVTNRKFVFKSKNNNMLKEFYLFVSARIFSGVIDTLIMFVGIDILKISDLIIKVFANVVVVIINYIFSKLIIFRKEVKNEVN